VLKFLKDKIDKKKSTLNVYALIDAVRMESPHVYSITDLQGNEAVKKLITFPKKEQKEIVLHLVDVIEKMTIKQGKLRSYTIDENFYIKSTAQAIQSSILRRKLDYTEDEWMNLIECFKKAKVKLAKYKEYDFPLHLFPINYAIKQMEYYLKKKAPSKQLVAFAEDILKWKEFDENQEKVYSTGSMLKASKKLRSLFSMENQIPLFSLKTEDIGTEINQIINQLSENKELYSQIFIIASGISGAKPTKKKVTEIKKLQDIIGLDNYKKTAQAILYIPLQLQPQIETNTHEYNGNTYTSTHGTYLCDPSQQFIKGMVWTMDRFSDKETISILSRLCEKAYTKVPGRGPAAASIGNSCVHVLGSMRGKDGLGAISRLKLKLRQNNIKKLIDTYLTEGAKKYSVSIQELEEMAVPDFQLVRGRKSLEFGEYTLTMEIASGKVIQQWVKPDGSSMKSVPSAVKNSSALSTKLKTIRKEAKEIQKVYSAQKQRIDNQFILDRTWDYASFQKYYLQHGLVSPIAGKLIWTLSNNNQSTEGIFNNDSWQDINGQIIKWVDNETTVKIWHPVYAEEDKIIAWRDKMMELEWKQPIKQAFRELYILTDAEVNTRSYSNRMAAHILKQHQFSSLASIRGWKYSLLGAYDDGRDEEICLRRLPEFELTAEFWIDPIYQDDNWNDAGILLYITTDQVKFKDAEDEVLDLVDIPKVVFSEIMRDVDLFVGVASVGNDPQWIDSNGNRQANRDYWNHFSFGDLNEVAKTRKAVLERLLPRLKKIRDVAHLDGKFLNVKGKLRTYKIHIGSGNILMEPNDQYLCIVPERSSERSTDKLFIPFEGDRGLSIVLSKAFLLAEDDKITDTTITSQIKRSR